MAELELTRMPADRRLYAIDGIGTLRLEGLWSRSASAEAGQRSWLIFRTGFWRRVVQATDAVGSVAGEFEPRAVRRGGPLRWGERELELRPASAWRERYALADGARELAVLEGKGWGKRPVRIIVADPAAIDAGLLLFAAFVVRGLAEDSGAAAGAAASGAVVASGS
jgi:hypothetical protein